MTKIEKLQQKIRKARFMRKLQAKYVTISISKNRKSMTLNTNKNGKEEQSEVNI